MDELINFFIEIGKLQQIPKRGWVLIGEKEPQTISEHSFRVAMMAWLLAKERKVDFNMERLIKIALIHDICEVYAGDTTPYDYDAILPKDKTKWPELFDKWPRIPKAEKIKSSQEKYEKERSALQKLTSQLSPETKNEVLNLWLDYERGSTKEGRFVRQVNRLETLLQALEYGKKSGQRPFKSWWIGSKEKIDDPFLIKFMEKLDKRFSPPKEES